MMLRAKIFLLWLLALAIPVQGFAAVLQSACAPMQHAMSMDAMPAMTTSPAHQHHAGMDMSMSADHSAPSGHAMDHTMADANSDTQAPHHSLHKASSSCSSCATCNVGAVIPLALNALPAPDLPSREFLALPTSGFVGYTPENPDRPPSLA